MHKTFRIRFGFACSGNPKSKTCGERRRTIENPKWVGIFAIVVTLTVCGARAEAQQPGKATRIGYLEEGSAVGSGDLLDAFRKQMIQLGWVEGKNLAIEYRYAEGKIDRLAELADISKNGVRNHLRFLDRFSVISSLARKGQG